MRFDRLDLIRYGRFTDASLVFAPAEHDLQIVLGPNEAGKTTAMHAIEDLLFGIDARTPYNFLHPYPKLLLGAVLARGAQRLEVRRRKANRDTLLAADGSVLPEGDAALTPFLGTVTRATLTSMFSLDSDRLATGGREMLEAKGEAGYALFSAGTGLSGLRERARALEEAATELWTPRRSASRAVYVAVDALKAAQDRQRERTINAAKLQDAIRDRDTTESAFDKLDREKRQTTGELRRLGRVRRVYATVMRVVEIDRDLSEAGEPVVFPEDAETTLAAAIRDQAAAQASVDTLGGQLRHEKELRSQVACDDRLLARATDVEDLGRKRIEVRKAKSDLPQRKAELADKQKRLLHEAAGLGWTALSPADVAARIPGRALVTSANSLAAQHGTRLGALLGARSAAEELGAQEREFRDQLDVLPPAHDVSMLKAAIAAAQPARDVASRIATAEAERDAATKSAAAVLGRMRPPVASTAALEAVAVPPISAVTELRDQFRDHAKKVQASRERIDDLARSIQHLRTTLEQREHDEQVTTTEQVAAARHERDQGWRLVQAYYIKHDGASGEDIQAYCGSVDGLATMFVSRLQAADVLADLRFEKAESAGRLAAIGQQLRDLEADHAQELEAYRKLEAAGEELEHAWREAWKPDVLEPTDPDAMLGWLQQRDEVLSALDAGREAETRLSTLRAEEHEAKQALLKELARLGVPKADIDGRPLRVIVERASATCQEHERRASERGTLERQIRKAALGAKQKQASLRETEAALGEWESKWSNALLELRLPTDTTVEAALEQFAVIDQLRALADACAALQSERISTMERDIETFDHAVGAFVQPVAPDLAGATPDDAVIELERRVGEARQAKTRQEAADRHIGELEENLRQTQAKLTKASEAIAALQRVAGCETLDELHTALKRTQYIRTLRDERANHVAQLVRDGDGHTFAELRAECEATSIDAVLARVEELEQELGELEEQLQPATEARLQARQAVAAIGTGSAAASAAAEREEALTELRDVAARYVRARTAAMMLQWVIDAYQREKQGPLINHASALFAALTNQSFTGVRAEFNESDRARLVGVCADGSLVDVEGMSDGTTDQLYLALRLAAVHEHLDHAPPLPFIADDLLVNFDDTRSAAALRVLDEFSHRTQVLMFTHHPHLVALARARVRPDVHVVPLGR